MRGLISSAAAILLVSGFLLFINYRLEHKAGSAGKDTITVYNWGEYIDPDLLKEFEEKEGIKVIYETFDSNEGMMGKIEQGGTSYDVTVPSEYAVQMMEEKDLLIPLDFSKIPNIQHIDPYFMDLPFDPDNQYSIPYFWGTVGIAYNPSLLEGQTFESWDSLWDASLRQKLILVDSAREVIGVSLNSLGYSLNSTSLQELKEAADKLETMGPNVKAVIGDEVTQLMINNEASVALTWSGQAADMISENDEIDYIVPEEGSNLWFDNIVIPKTATNIEGAYKFINFMLDPEVAAQNAEYVGYSTPNISALSFMDEEITSDERFYPDEQARENLEVYENLGLETLGVYNELFLKFKMGLR
ncbi:spermidine/putrescine ABC transporter substrate-binding protein [Sporosarcina sp. P37]|uniref:ABC transporter substrate-binding protein n=1 Tax=unclassified Sporosarcina TaxID=2647733 RepID=UPI000A17F067|nr:MULTISPECIES: ABC transporter substrate-binding protein [unclassified Sporosarcina]ARK25631.1 spermidine/putrescine ABC transporter substrate-binding protein [Sporosarcina sp. P37]PID18032.1 spermidine/putrescine ABC transporter substrate-binding protein [Sporosarcina sp. P35]